VANYPLRKSVRQLFHYLTLLRVKALY